MKIDLNYINNVDIYPPETIKTKEDKEFYHQKLVIKGSKDLITLILRSNKELLKPTIKQSNNAKQ